MSNIFLLMQKKKDGDMIKTCTAGRRKSSDTIKAGILFIVVGSINISIRKVMSQQPSALTNFLHIDKLYISCTCLFSFLGTH